VTEGVWVLTDGRPGNENPARALADALRDRGWPEARIVRAEPRAWAARLPASAWSAWPARRSGWPFSGFRDPSVFDAPWPRLVVSAGRRSAPAAAAMRRLSGRETRAVQILDPRMGATRFDALVAQAHDGLTGATVVATLGSLSRAPTVATDPRLDGLPSPKVAVLLGGPSGAARWSAEDGDALRSGLERLASRGVGLAVTPSRRTPSGLVRAVRSVPGVWVWDGEDPNPYPAMLTGAAAALVTADSVNMASEAATAGLPVLVAPVSGLSPKLRRFHEALRVAGHARPFRGVLETWTPPPLNEAARVAALLERHYIGRP